MTPAELRASLEATRAEHARCSAEVARAAQRRDLLARRVRAIEELIEVARLLGEDAQPELPPCPELDVRPQPAWRRRARSGAPEPGPESRAGRVLGWLRDHRREEGHTNPEIAAGVLDPSAPGWRVAPQLSALYQLGVLQRRELVPARPGGRYAYRAFWVGT